MSDIYIYKYKNMNISPGEQRFLQLCKHWNIRVQNPIKTLREVIQQTDSQLDPYIEVVHIHAWFLLCESRNERRIWTYNPGSRFHYPIALRNWFQKTRREESMKWQSKNAFFEQAKLFFDVREPKRIKPEPDLWEEVTLLDDENWLKIHMSSLRDAYQGEDLTERLHRLLNAVGYREQPWIESMAKLIDFYDHQRIVPPLIEFAKTECYSVGSLLNHLHQNDDIGKMMRATVAREMALSPEERCQPDNRPVYAPQQIESPPEPEPEPFKPQKGMRKVKVRLDGYRVKFIGWEISQEAGISTVQLSAPVDGAEVVSVDAQQVQPMRHNGKIITAP